MDVGGVEGGAGDPDKRGDAGVEERDVGGGKVGEVLDVGVEEDVAVRERR